MDTKNLQRHTRQRHVILEELCRLKSHPTAADLYTIVRERIPRISLGTVYRNLEKLAHAGAIRKMEYGSGEARYDGDTDVHDHVRCIRCGRLDDMDAPSPSWPAMEEPHCRGYKILGRRLEYQGLCPQCLVQERLPQKIK